MGADSIGKNAKWYVVHTYSGYENKVKTNLEKIIDNKPRETSRKPSPVRFFRDMFLSK